jgi:type I restriction enzyme S subunit
VSWQKVQLAEVCNITMGQAPVGSSYNEKNIGYALIAGAGDFGESTPTPKKFTTAASKISGVGDLILCIRATIGDLNWSDKQYCLGRGVAGLNPKNNLLDKNYLWHFIGSNKQQLSSLGTGSTFKQINSSHIREFEIPLPPLAEQKRIAAILDKADGIRRKRQQATQLADEFLRTVFLDMFGDPNSNLKEWDLTTLGDLIEFAKDGPHVSPRYSESGIPFLSTRHIKSTGVVWEDLKYVSHEEADLHWKKCKPQKGDILYTKGGTTGIACPVSFEKDFAVWVHVALVRPKASLVNYIWLTHMLNTKYCYEQSQKLTRGATNKDLGLKRMVDIKMFAPPIEEQVKFVNLKNKVLKLLSKFDDSYAFNFFESLSQKAFAGKL